MQALRVTQGGTVVALNLTRLEFGVLMALLEDCIEAPNHPLKKECKALRKVLAAQAGDDEDDSFQNKQ